jgi:hypothetical protein
MFQMIMILICIASIFLPMAIQSYLQLALNSVGCAFACTLE